MASLETVAKNIKDLLDEGLEWVAIYKEGRSWNYHNFFPTDGSYDDGYELDEDDLVELYKAGATDGKAICINGFYMAIDNMPVYRIIDKIEYFYNNRLNQLDSDFLKCMVVNE